LRGHVEAAGLGPYLPFLPAIQARGRVSLTSRHVDDKKVTDHTAIIPATQRVDPAALPPDEKRLYDLIARRFLAAFYPDAELERTTLSTEVEGERFTTRGTVVLAAGWQEVDPPRRARQAPDDAAEAVEALPPVRVHDAVETRQAETLTKHTKAPPRNPARTRLGPMEPVGTLLT